MKILLVHNHYELAGGEDVVLNYEEALLRAHYEQVNTYAANNEEIADIGMLNAARNTL